MLKKISSHQSFQHVQANFFQKLCYTIDVQLRAPCSMLVSQTLQSRLSGIVPNSMLITPGMRSRSLPWAPAAGPGWCGS